MHKDGIGPLKRGYRSVKKELNNLATSCVTQIAKRNKESRIFIVVGLRRTGNHVLINWIKSQQRGMFAFYNNIGEEEWPLKRHRREFKIGWFDKPLTIFSYEDKFREQIFSDQLSRTIEQYQLKSGSVTVVALLRDPYNLHASRAQKWPQQLRDAEQRKRWNQLFMEAADIYKSKELFSFPVIPVSYNEFLNSSDYRYRLSGLLGLSHSDAGLAQVTNYGHGSSFDGEKLTANPKSMQVFDRWKKFVDDPDFLSLFDKDIVEVSEEVFGFNPMGGQNRFGRLRRT